MRSYNSIKDFKEVWLVDFEFYCPAGEKPSPICLVATELHSNKTIRLFQEQLNELSQPPYSIDEDSLFVAYYSSAEFSCHLALGWSLPTNVLDLFCEFRNSTNGKYVPSGNGLLGALAYYGLVAIDVIEKKEMRNLAMRGGPYTEQEKMGLLNYCESDVVALKNLIEKMQGNLDLPRALIRGRYMKAASHIEKNGIPIDCETYTNIKKNLPYIKDELIGKVDPEVQIYEGTTFKYEKFATYIKSKNIPWPRHESGRLALDEKTFEYMAKRYNVIYPIYELRKLLSQARKIDLPIGSDNRNRCLLSVFRAKTGRNQPSSSNFIFGFSAFWRRLIKPEQGYGIAYIDWSQQEFGIAAALSKDEKMMEAYSSGDPYLSFAKQAGAAPKEATKKTHSEVRDLFKACALAVQYGMSAPSLAERINKTLSEGKELLRLHKETYSKFWNWSDGAVDYAMLSNGINTIFGWNYYVKKDDNPRSLRNFPIQANGSEMLRLACCFAVERNIKVCAPIHDAILIEAPLEQLDSAIATAQQAMEDASSVILDGFKLRSDVKIVRYPDRYVDERGTKMWDIVLDLINAKRSNR